MEEKPDHYTFKLVTFRVIYPTPSHKLHLLRPPYTLLPQPHLVMSNTNLSASWVMYLLEIVLKITLYWQVFIDIPCFCFFAECSIFVALYQNKATLPFIESYFLFSYVMFYQDVNDQGSPLHPIFVESLPINNKMNTVLLIVTII